MADDVVAPTRKRARAVVPARLQPAAVCFVARSPVPPCSAGNIHGKWREEDPSEMMKQAMYSVALAVGASHSVDAYVTRGSTGAIASTMARG
jgi:hypothetical protein